MDSPPYFSFGSELLFFFPFSSIACYVCQRSDIGRENSYHGNNNHFRRNLGRMLQTMATCQNTAQAMHQQARKDGQKTHFVTSNWHTIGIVETL